MPLPNIKFQILSFMVDVETYVRVKSSVKVGNLRLLYAGKNISWKKTKQNGSMTSHGSPGLPKIIEYHAQLQPIVFKGNKLSI